MEDRSNRGIQSLAERVELIYDDSFDDFKERIFRYWILEAIVNNRKTTDGKVAYDVIWTYLTSKLNIDVRSNEKTSKLFQRSLTRLVDDGCIDDEPRAGKALVEYRCLAPGQRILEERKRDKNIILEQCFCEFASVIDRAIFTADLNGREHSVHSHRSSHGSAHLHGGDTSWSQELQRKCADIEARVQTLVANQEDLRRGFALFLDIVGDGIDAQLPGVFFQTLLEPAVVSGSTTLPSILRFKKDLDSRTKHAVISALEGLRDKLLARQFGGESSLGRWFYFDAIRRLIGRSWPDENLKSRLTAHLNCAYIYLDTNVIIAALAKNHERHQTAHSILRFMNELNINYYWLQPTETEFLEHLQLSERISKVLEGRPKQQVFEVLSLIDAPPFVKAYFLSEWRSWRQFEDYILDGYYYLRDEKSKWDKVTKLLNNEAGLSALVERYTPLYQQMLQGGEAIIEHDAWMLATVKSLREIHHNELISEPCTRAFEAGELVLGELFWLVTFDKKVDILPAPQLGFFKDVQLRQARVKEFSLTLRPWPIMMLLDPWIVHIELSAPHPKLPVMEEAPLLRANYQNIRKVVDAAILRKKSEEHASVAGVIQRLLAEWASRDEEE